MYPKRNCNHPLLIKHFLLLMGVFFLFGFLRNAFSKPNSDGEILAEYQVTLTIESNACYSKWEKMQKNYIWQIIQFPDRWIILNRNANVVNPIEHTDLIFQKNPYQKSSQSFQGPALAKDDLQMPYGDFGILKSKISYNLFFDNTDVKGDFVNEVDFSPGILGRSVLGLWVQSHESLKKAPSKTHDVPTIDQPTPCKLKGTLEGKRLPKISQTFSPLLELQYFRMMRKTEEYFSTDKNHKAIEVLKEMVQTFPNRAKPYWMLARSYFISAEHMDPEDEKGRLKLLAHAENNSRKAIQLEPKSGESLFFLTATLGRIATTKGILQALRVTGRLERGFLKVIAFKPEYNFAGFCTAGDTQTGLGIYYRIVPDWWLVKLLTGSRGDIDTSIVHLKNGLLYQPYRVEYNKEYGVSLLCRGHRQKNQKDIEEGLQVLRKALELPNLLKTDRIDKKHIRELLVNHGKACGYSRDGYEDISEEAYSQINGGKKESSLVPVVNEK